MLQYLPVKIGDINLFLQDLIFLEIRDLDILIYYMNYYYEMLKIRYERMYFTIFWVNKPVKTTKRTTLKEIHDLR